MLSQRALVVSALLLAAGGLLWSPPASAVSITYEVTLTPADGVTVFDTTGGPTFDSADFTPGGQVTADAFDFVFDFGLVVSTFSVGDCTPALTGHVNAAGTAVTALSGTCAEPVDNTSIDFSSDNTADIAPFSVLLAFEDATYTLTEVPEPAAAALVGLAATFSLALRRRRR